MYISYIKSVNTLSRKNTETNNGPVFCSCPALPEGSIAQCYSSTNKVKLYLGEGRLVGLAVNGIKRNKIIITYWVRFLTTFSIQHCIVITWILINHGIPFTFELTTIIDRGWQCQLLTDNVSYWQVMTGYVS